MKALHSASFVVRAVSRLPPPTEIPSAVSTALVDYSSIPSLVETFAGYEAIVEAFSPGAFEHQRNVVDAAIRAKIKHIITPDFSSDTFNENVSELAIFEPKLKAQRYLETKAKEGHLTWTAVTFGPLFDWGKSASSSSIKRQKLTVIVAIRRNTFWVSLPHRTVTRFGSGNQKISMSKLNSVGTAIVTILRSTPDFRNRPAYFADYSMSTNELLAILQETFPNERWKVKQVPIEMLFEEGRRLWTSNIGIEFAVQKRHARKMLGTHSTFEEHNRYSANFENKLEPDCIKSKDQLAEDMRALISESQQATVGIQCKCCSEGNSPSSRAVEAGNMEMPDT